MTTYDEQLKRSLRWLTIAIVLLYFGVLATGGFFLGELHERRDELAVVAVNTNDALCTFRADLKQRYEDGVQFLKENPDGIPGITPETIQNSLDNQERTLKALDSLICVKT